MIREAGLSVVSLQLRSVAIDRVVELRNSLAHSLSKTTTSVNRGV